MARGDHRFDGGDVWRQDRDHYIHPWTDFSTFKSEGSQVITRGHGVHVYDAAGRKMIDGIGGLWCVNIGYGNEEMVEAIAAQARELCYYCTFHHYTTPPAAKLAAKLSQLAPGNLNHVFYGTGGSVGNDTAIRTLHHYFNRLGKRAKKKIISRVDAYHGSTYLAATLTGIEIAHEEFDLVPGLVHYVSAPSTYRRPDGMSVEAFRDEKVKELENKIVELGPENVAAFIAEPIMGAGGVIVPPPGYHRRTSDVCKKYGVMYISDEVVTAFGRLGHFFASEAVFGLTPDIIVSAKGITSGYIPLSATLLSDEIHEVISRPRGDGKMFTHGFTYSGHSIACAAGLKNIEIMERERICEHVREIGPYFERRLAELGDLPLVGDVRGSCLMMCLEFVADRKSRKSFDAGVKIGRRVAAHCQDRGLMVRPQAHLVVLSPPLIVTREHVDTITEVMRRSILAVQDDLIREGLWKG
jgi:adenosylmethionine-8-amino-7-oxononanoate aminotransferase